MSRHGCFNAIRIVTGCILWFMLFSLPASADELPPSTEIRINCGGGQYTDTDGNVWSADTGYNTGYVSSTSAAISNTVDDTLYQSERWDPSSAPEMAYGITVPNGDYLVRLHFAENYEDAAFVGGRVFDVEIEGVLALDNLDIFSEAGFNTALIKTMNATVSDGQIDIVFSHVVEDPKISAIEILSSVDTSAPSVPTGLSGTVMSDSQIDLTWNASTDTGGSGLAGYHVYRDGVQVGSTTATNYSDTGLSAGTMYSYTVSAYDSALNESGQSSPPVQVQTTSTEIRINCGGGQYTDTDGNVWSADTGYNTGNVSSTSAAIGNTVDDTLYQTERWDSSSAPEMTYSFSVPNGDYLVKLHFAEIYEDAAFVGGRVFDVEIEGVLVLDNLDIFSEVGFNVALIKTMNATVSDGQIDIVFRHMVEDPKVSAIEILSGGGSSNPDDGTQPAIYQFYYDKNGNLEQMQVQQ